MNHASAGNSSVRAGEIRMANGISISSLSQIAVERISLNRSVFAAGSTQIDNHPDTPWLTLSSTASDGTIIARIC